jgi:hypothetical protein
VILHVVRSNDFIEMTRYGPPPAPGVVSANGRNDVSLDAVILTGAQDGLQTIDHDVHAGFP